MARRGRKKADIVLPMHISRPAGNGPIIIAGTVPDPYEPGKTLGVVKNARSSAVDALNARKRLGPPELAEARLRAAKTFMGIFEDAMIGGASAVDYGRVKVDVSFRYSGIADHTLCAIHALADVRRALRRHYELVEAVCGVGLSLEEIATRMRGGPPSRRYKLALAQTLRDGLDKLADHFGVAHGPVRGRIVAYREPVATN